MSEELQIPLLTELISKGHQQTRQPHFDSNADKEVDIEIDDQIDLAYDDDDEPIIVTEEELADDPIEDFTSVRELLIEEEIRMILDKHMENAYEEIIRMINHKLS